MDYSTLEREMVVGDVDYRALMKGRIRNVLLVCNSYDGFSLEEDGRIESQINQEYSGLNLNNPLMIARAESTEEAMELLNGKTEFDLVITMYNVGELDPITFSRKVKEKFPNLPVVLLFSYSHAVRRRLAEQDTSSIDYIFCWQGSADLILAIVKLIEDKMNAEHDILDVGVQAIMLVEDSVRYYSTYLPTIYKLIIQHTSSSDEALNEQQSMMRKRARPKILLATSYNEAVGIYKKYRENLLGVISDVGFVINKGDDTDTEKLDAGIDLCRLIKSESPLMPFLLQSSQKSVRVKADELGVGFLEKRSKTLLLQLNDYIRSEFAFGDLVFKEPETGIEVARVKDLRELQNTISWLPEKILTYGTSQNMISKWLLSRGLFFLGNMFKGFSPENFKTTDEMREFVIHNITEYRRYLGQAVVAKFDNRTYDDTIWFARMGNGSLGGKARGLAFLNSMLQKYHTYNKWEGVRITIPRTVVVTTDYFDEFIRENELQFVINSDMSDEDILSEFVSSRLPQALLDSLRVYIRYTKGPLAIRSSSKLEDSYYQPFAGVYSTYMIPKAGDDQMMRMLSRAIKSVYASVYFASSRAYITATNNVISDEKMAIVIQDVCGSEDGGYFLPTLSGVARSMNFYPIGDEKPEDGVVKLACGLGKAVVDGEQVLRFSPRYPKHVLQLSTPELALRETQRKVYALSTSPEKFKTSLDEAVNIAKLDLMSAKGLKAMRHVSSTWDMQSQMLVDSPFAEGRKVITCAHILKYGTFPLSEILCELLQVYQRETRCNIEIEFAVNMDTPSGEPKVFNLLQIRPIAEEMEGARLDWNKVEHEGEIIYSESAIGIGKTDSVTDIVYVKRKSFDSAATRTIAEQVQAINNRMKAEQRGYVLIGPGRWGSSDPWLGIPVSWVQISEARVIVECGLDNFRVDPSQGTHFFQNLTSFGVGYLTINPYMGDGVFNEEVLDAMPAVEETEYVRRVRFDKPLYIYVDGLSNKAIVKQEIENID